MTQGEPYDASGFPMQRILFFAYGLLIHALQRRWKGAILVVTADDDDSLALAEDIAAFRPKSAKLRAPQTLITELYDIDGQVDHVTRSQP